MSKLQKIFTDVLSGKKRVIGVSKYAVQRWANGSTSPTISTMEKICNDNDIELPFFFDGKVESLVEYNKSIGKRMGFKVQLIFEA